MGLIVPEPIDRYLQALNRAGDDLLAELARDGLAQGLPLVDAQVGALLRLLTIAAGTEGAGARVLEIGTAIGYSGLWIAGGLGTTGRLLTLELDNARAATAKANFARAGLGDRAHVMVGDAALLVRKVAGPFDLIFQDGPKRLYGPLLDPLVGKLRTGGFLVTHNVLWGGEVVPHFVQTPRRAATDTAAIAAYNEQLNARSDLIVATIPIDDGVSIAVKKIEHM
jgi:predicted O-methyltransferase YrrM